MKEKYLPIGTVCEISGFDHKVMIIGYFYKYVNNSKIYDYCACLHPEGLISKNNKFLFNHENITDILALGYKNESAIEYNKQLIELNSRQDVSDLKFDQNGIVVADGNGALSTIEIPKLQFNENGIVIGDASANNISEQNNDSNIRFNENGIVIADASINNMTEQNNGSNIRFNENGIVIADASINNMAEQNNGSNIRFNENGIVIADASINNISEQNNVSNIRFNENGIVIAE